MKTHFKPLVLSAALFCGALIATSCGGGQSTGSSISSEESHGTGFNPSSESSLSPSSSSSSLTPSEQVMEKFIAKINEGNYTIDSEMSTVSVYSQDLITVTYSDEVQGAADFGSMSIYNEEFDMYETFQVNLDNSGDIFKYVVFVDKGRAIDVQSKQLLNYWITATGGNIWAAWTSTQDPLVYKSNSTYVRDSIKTFFVMGTSEVGSISNMTLTFTDENLNDAHLTFNYNKGTPAVLTGDIHITFGGEIEYDQRLVDWMNDPNREYPDPISKGWNSTFQGDIFYILYTFSTKYVPVVPFGSYAAVPVIDHLLDYNGNQFFRVHDYHAKESNVQDYANVLLESGFAPFEEKGENWYYRHMRTKADDPAFMCYALINISYDDGLNIDIYNHYNRQIISSLDELNSYITLRYFPAFEESDAITGFNGFNSPLEASEGLNYFQNLETDGLYYFHYEDPAAIDAYISDYEGKLVAAGFVKSETTYTADIFKRVTSEGQAKIEIYPKADNMVHMLISYEKYVNPVLGIYTLNSLGFPEVPADNILFIQDHTKYNNLSTGAGWDLYYKIDFEFEDADAATKVFNDYVDAVVASGKYKKSPSQSYTMAYVSSDGRQAILGDNLGTTLLFWFGANY